MRKIEFQEDDQKIKLLPYGEEIKEESYQKLRELKTYFGSSLLLREVRVSLVYWNARLDWYVKLYGLRFTKEDHVLFIRILYDLITHPDLTLHVLPSLSSTLISLLRKRRFLIPGDDLVLPWRPFYDICKRVFWCSRVKQAILFFNFGVKADLQCLAEVVRYYFPPEATQEILDELRPYLCPFDGTAMKYGIQMLSMFLPLTNRPEYADITYKLWFDEIMKIWDACSNNCLFWEGHVLSLMSSLTWLNIGNINWENHFPLMYSRILRMFGLPVYYKKTNNWKMSQMSEDSVTLWIVSTLGGKSKSQNHLDQLLKILESYCHPANTGLWVTVIKSFLKKLCRNFINRVKRERFGKISWENKIPMEKKLTDEDIERFVVSMQSICMQAMFSAPTLINFITLFNELATLRADIVVPSLLNTLYSTIDSLTEPYKLLTALQHMCGLARPMLTGGFNDLYSQGKNHVIPLLFAVLPGIDPNDLRKSNASMQFICTFASMVPIVDCSAATSYYSDLTPEEKELAGATSQFEDFVIQFFDRIFLLIDNMAQENVRIENNSSDGNKLEQNIYEIMWVSCHLFVGQLSKSIFMVTLKKLYNYATMKIVEREVAGQAVASLIKAFAKVNGEETFKLFLPNLCNFILEAAKNRNIKDEEILDDELLYNMMLLSEIILATPEPLKPYIPSLLEVLDSTLHLKCKEGYEISTKLLAQILIIFSDIYPIDFRSSTRSYDDISQYLPLREWGKSSDINSLDIRWFQPQEAEIALVEQIFWKYLIPELENVDKYLNNELSRENLRCTLNIIFSLFACGNLLDPWNEEPPVAFYESKLPILSMTLNVGVKRYIRMPDGSNVYKVVIEKMAFLQEKLLKETDDTISFMSLIKIWSHLLYYDEFLDAEFKVNKRRTRILKSCFKNHLEPAKRNVRFILIQEMAIKHMRRVLVSENNFTETHKIALMKLFELSLIEYKLVQAKAQRVLNKMLRFYLESSVLLKDQIIQNLKEDNKFSEKFQSTLAIIKGHRRREWPSLLQNFERLKDILPALVNSIPNEEPTVIKLMGEVTSVIAGNPFHGDFKIQIPENIIEQAKQLWTHSEIELVQDMPSEEEIKDGCVALVQENEKNSGYYRELMKSLLDAAQFNNLHWRYERMAVTFLVQFLTPDQLMPIELIRFFLKLLIHDSVFLRKIAVKTIVYIMKIHKLKAIKEKVDPYVFGSGQNTINTFPGHRVDNAWFQYTENNIPRNESQWNEPRFSYSCYIGYYCWPKELYLHSSSSIQPLNNLKEDQFTEINKEFNEFFSNKSNIDTLIRFFSLEEFKGETLRILNIALFKYLFKIYGDRYVDVLKPHLEKLVIDQEESHQRCAAEMLTGIIQGTKLWTFSKTEKIMSWCAPLLKKSLSNITDETSKHWGSAIASVLYNGDVNKSHYLLEAIMDEPIKGDAAYKDCGRLFALQGSGLCSWRLTELWCRLLEDIKPHLANQFQNLRERLGSVLVSIFETDIEIANWNRTPSPHVSNFIEYLLPKLEILDSVVPNSKSIQVYPPRKKARIENYGNSNGDEIHSDGDKDVQNAIQLLQTICRWCTYSIYRCVYTMKPEFLKIFPLFCYMENYVNDEELRRNCKGTLSVMSYAVILPNNVPIFLEAVEKVSKSNSWCAKCTGLEFVQVFAFHNIFIVSQRQEWISQILNILCKLLEDERCEVRQKAGEVISGFIHYNIIKETEDLLNKFKKMRRKPLTKKSNINIRHAGVIGLCSFINAYPYTVPPEVPELFVEIGDHLSDPEPIPSTIRKTLGNFKRTHYADWDCLKTMFTSDQLDIFIDISVPPNHYA